METVYVPKSPHEKAMQRALIQYRNPKNYELVEEALRLAHREDLIGFDKKCLIRPRKFVGEGHYNKKPDGKASSLQNISAGKQSIGKLARQSTGKQQMQENKGVQKHSTGNGAQRGKGSQMAGGNKSVPKKKTIRNTHAKKK